MIIKIKEFIKINWRYCIYVIMLFITTVVSMIHIYYNKNNNSFSKSSYTNYFIFMIILLLLISLNLLFFYLRKNSKFSVERVFLYIVIPIGIGFLVFNPMGRVPDESNHMEKTISIANR